jgi:pilus assembly protein FimV
LINNNLLIQTQHTRETDGGIFRAKWGMLTPRVLVSWLILGWLLPGPALALGLGSIQVYSHLQQPLRADIALLAIPHDTVGQVQAALASPQDFDWIGLKRDQALEDLVFTPLINSKGKPVIRVTSTQPITQSRLDLLLDVRWSRRHLLREYTIEVKTQAPVRSTALPTAAPAISRSARPPIRAKTPAKAPATTPETTPKPVLEAAPEMTLPSEPGQTNRYRTVRGDTLSGIARRHAPRGIARLHRMVQAIYAANPHAFLHGDIDQLMAGVVLQIPQGEELARLDRPQPEPRPKPPAVGQRPAAPASAASRPRRPEQKESPHETSEADKAPPAPQRSPPVQDDTAPGEQPPRLEIVSDQDTKAPAGAAVATSKEYLTKLERTVTLAQELAESRLQEANELQGRIQTLQGVIAKQDRLIALQSEQLTNLIARTEVPKPAPARSPALGIWLMGALLGLTVVLAVLVLRLYLRK